MAVKGAPVIITTKNGIPVRHVESGGYFSIHKLTNARMMFKDMVISPSGAIP